MTTDEQESYENLVTGERHRARELCHYIIIFSTGAILQHAQCCSVKLSIMQGKWDMCSEEATPTQCGTFTLHFLYAYLQDYSLSGSN